MLNKIETLNIILIAIISIIAVLLVILCMIYFMSKNKKNKKEKTIQSENTTKEIAKSKTFAVESVMNFMEFDKIEDNMIVQKDGNKYVMVVECQGINYDLMSEVEKNSVEEGFIQFLNTIRHPIQIYTQTRTVNISESITNYSDKLEETKKELDIKQAAYARLLRNESYNEKQAEGLAREILRLKNLYEYGNDVIENIQKTSQNKNVLRKHYYIVIPYYSAELGGDLLDEEERGSMIFSELYTRAQSIIRTLSACSIKSRVLNSNELVELLYIAYNRDESDVYSVEKAIRAGYNELYSTAQDVLDKKMQALDEKIEREAVKLARETINVVREEKERKIKNKEVNFEALVKKMAEDMLKENQKYVGKEVTEKSIKKLRGREEGGVANEQKTKRTTVAKKSAE